MQFYILTRSALALAFLTGSVGNKNAYRGFRLALLLSLFVRFPVFVLTIGFVAITLVDKHQAQLKLRVLCVHISTIVPVAETFVYITEAYPLDMSVAAVFAVFTCRLVCKFETQPSPLPLACGLIIPVDCNQTTTVTVLLFGCFVTVTTMIILVKDPSSLV